MIDPRFAFDRSARSIDGDGHLHVSSSVITCARVSPYLGAEIPGYVELGLDASRTYHLLRDPDELQRAAPTLAGKPLLNEHVPVSSDNHRHGIVVGAVANPVWRSPDLSAELTVWDGAAIRAIQNGTERALSAAYKYVPVMTPGTYQGVRYDGCMTNIEFNHVALVSDPRVPGAMVGDAKPRSLQQKRCLLVMDEDNSEITPRDDLLTQIQKFLQDKLSPGDMAVLQELISNDAAGGPQTPAQAMDSARRRRAAEISSAREAFNNRFPDAARIRVIG